ncbi:hypothetical protein BHE74_00019061 [Ensete ventricosum]|nr:hypothetical protein GW17_00041811 [Ensete ventricosum]RWW73094.1 hypothetical protein BHE74_00019061 [Ensete ventricosum]RZS01606.1 hypothetical protein BHM03_00031492 [Ensete ventricosum]
MRALRYKRAVAELYDHEVCPWKVELGDLVLRKAKVNDLTKSREKLASKWEGPYRVVEVVRDGTYCLETSKGVALPRTWHVANLKFYQ